MRLLILFCLAALPVNAAADTSHRIALVHDPSPGRASQHGLRVLRSALLARGWQVDESTAINAATAPLRILAGTRHSQGAAATALATTPALLPDEAEALTIATLPMTDQVATVVLCGADDRGLMYALLETATRIAWAEHADQPLSEIPAIAESPAVRERTLSIYALNRTHWESRFYDDRYWQRYLDTLATHRFNRLLIVFGDEESGFLSIPYPYFFITPGFNEVKMTALTNAEQQRNLAALNRLIEQAHDRGIEVSLEIHDPFRPADRSAEAAASSGDPTARNARSPITGLTGNNLPAYTLAALQELLARVPALDRLHIHTDNAAALKRNVPPIFGPATFAPLHREKLLLQIDASTLAVPQPTNLTALPLSIDLRIASKEWHGHLGLPYQRLPTNRRPPLNVSARAAGLPTASPTYEIIQRLGNDKTARVLLWADPDYVRRYSASSQPSRTSQWNVSEPLAKKMAAQPADLPTFALLASPYRHYDYEFERYWHFFQVWGRLGYNPNTDPAIWQREFVQRFGRAAGPPIEAGLHRASQVLPMIVAAVYPHARLSSHHGWPERQSLGPNLADYANNEGGDPEQFESFIEAARRILASTTTTKRTPAITSRWFDETADAILTAVQAATLAAGPTRSLEFDATVTDLKILAHLARFHARRSLAAVHYNLFKRGLRLAELVAATYAEKDAVAAWRELVAAAGDRYTSNLAMGPRQHNESGHWRDELKQLEAGLKELEEQCCPPDEAIMKEKVWSPPGAGDGAPPQIASTPAPTARPHEDLVIFARVTDPAGIQHVRLRYRRTPSLENYRTLTMTLSDRPGGYTARIPADFITPSHDLQYFIETTDTHGNGTNWPDLTRESPYVLVTVTP